MNKIRLNKIKYFIELDKTEEKEEEKNINERERKKKKKVQWINKQNGKDRSMIRMNKRRNRYKLSR